MRKVLFWDLSEDFWGRMISLTSIFMIVLLMGACAGKKEMLASSNLDEAVQASTKSETAGSEISDDQTIVCRRIAPTGSRLKRKVCKTKALWALESGSGNKAAGDLQQEIDRNYSKTAPSTDAMGGMSAGVPR